MKLIGRWCRLAGLHVIGLRPNEREEHLQNHDYLFLEPPIFPILVCFIRAPMLAH